LGFGATEVNRVLIVTPLRIALFTYSTKPRGSVIHTLELAQALHQLGHYVCVYALDKDGTGFDYPLSCNYHLISARSAPPDIDQLIQQRIQEFVQDLSQSDQTFDCYHAQDCISANALAKLVEQHKIPAFIRTVHHIEDYQSFYLQQCQDHSIRKAALCFCVSHQWQIELQKQYQIDAPRVINGVNLDRFMLSTTAIESSLQNRWQLTGDPIYLTVGGIEPRKNSICLLQAFAQVLETHPQAQLVIAGGATLFDYQDYRNAFFSLAERLAIDDRSLILPGVIADAELPALYHLADAFVFPSLKEGWGMVLLEAIASGLPVITSNQAPFTEFLSSAQALLVNPNSPSAIAQAMRQVTQKKLANSLIQKSQSLLSQYTWMTSAKLHVSYYQQLLKSYA